MEPQVRVRFAPNPLEELHLDGVRTTLYNYVVARRLGGVMVLRLEDAGYRRPRRGPEERLLEELHWLGLRWGEGPDVGGPYGPYRQSERPEFYQAAVRQLLAMGYAYPCYCTPAELAAERAAARSRGEPPRYSGRCVDPARREALAAEGRPYVVRFRVPAGAVVSFDDAVLGPVSFAAPGLDDFIIYRPKRRVPLYNLAAVVDDHAMQISHVIRGAEHLPNTPRQILLYRALGWEAPAFAHLPPVMRRGRARLSRRDEPTSIAAYRSAGYLPEAILNHAALLGWTPEGSDPLIGLEDLVRDFRLEKVAGNPAVFEPERLAWFNRQYLRALPLGDAVERVRPFLLRAYGVSERSAGTAHSPERWLEILVEALRAESATIEALADGAAFCLLDPLPAATAEAREVLAAPEATAVIRACAPRLTPEDVSDAEAANRFFGALRREFKEQHGLSGKQVMFPLRAALAGTLTGPCLGVVATLLGWERCHARLSLIA